MRPLQALGSERPSSTGRPEVQALRGALIRRALWAFMPSFCGRPAFPSTTGHTSTSRKTLILNEKSKKSLPCEWRIAEDSFYPSEGPDESSNRVNCFKNDKNRLPVGPFRCFPMMQPCERAAVCGQGWSPRVRHSLERSVGSGSFGRFRFDLSGKSQPNPGAGPL
jgi:hypothetical protein